MKGGVFGVSCKNKEKKEEMKEQEGEKEEETERIPQRERFGLDKSKHTL